MHGAAYLQFSTIVQLSKVFQFMKSSMSSSKLPAILDSCLSIPQVLIYVAVIGWGWWGTMVVVGKKHMRKLDFQMGSNEVLLCL